MIDSEPPVAKAILARLSIDAIRDEIVATLGANLDGFDQLAPAAREDIAVGVERAVRRWQRWMSTGIAPADPDFDPLRAWARLRAQDGIRLDQLLRAFSAAGQLCWRHLLDSAKPDEQAELLASVHKLFSYVELISTVVTETYLAERDVLLSEADRETRDLLDALCSELSPSQQTMRLAERLRVPVADLFTPFAINLRGQDPHRHSELASRLRRRGYRLVIAQGDRVEGLLWMPLPFASLGEPDALLAMGRPTPRSGLREARRDTVLLAEHGSRSQRRGLFTVSDHLMEVLLGRSPGLSHQIRERVLGPLVDDGREELLETLRSYVDGRVSRTATSTALHIHRNTLTYRLRQIEGLTGLDLANARDLALVYLAIQVPPDLGS